MKIFNYATLALIIILCYGYYIKVTYTPPSFILKEAPLPILNIIPVVTPSIVPEKIITKAGVALPDSPTKLILSMSSPTQINLKWNKSSSNIGVEKYRIYRNNNEIGTTIYPYYSDIDFSTAANYTYFVTAYDTNGIESLPSNKVSSKYGNINTDSTKPPTSKPVIVPTPVIISQPTPQPQLPACGSGGTCTAADIAPHNTRSNCWIYLSGSSTSKFNANKAYNITDYVANGYNHPGGDVIASLCGNNLYSYVVTGTGSGGKSHSSSAINVILQSYYIGPFQ
jgi:hypothetical protein